MAFLRALTLHCELCKTGRASVELVDRWNGSLGVFCKRCGAVKLKAQGLAERRSAEREKALT